MAVVLIPFGDPKKFVSWKFVCKTRAEKALKNQIANQKLKYFLAGFNAGIVSLGKKKNDFVIKSNVFKPGKKANSFLFEPLVFRKSKGGGVDLSGTKVQKPTQPNP